MDYSKIIEEIKDKNENYRCFIEQLVLKRESCRSYNGEPVSEEKLCAIVEAGRLAPSGCNAQPWRFMVVNSAEAKMRLWDALELKNGISGCAWREQVPAFIVVVEQKADVKPMVLQYFKDSQRFALGDLGMAVLNMCYAATSLDLSTCVVGMVDQEKMVKNFGIPADNTVRMVLAVGYSNTPEALPRKKQRKSFEDVCSFNQF